MARRSHNSAPTQPLSGTEWRAFGLLLPYLLEYKWRVAAALVFLAAAKVANVAVPLVMKEVVDGLDAKTAIVAVPAALLAIYGLLRFSTTLFAELRDVVFVRVTQRAIRRVALGVFRHLHRLSLRFHLERQTGGMTRDIERGTRGISTPAVLPAVLDHPGHHRVHAGGRGAAEEVRLALRRDHFRRRCDLSDLHRAGDRVADGDPAPRERARFERQHARDRQPAQLRDGEVFRQRGIRGPALRRESVQVRERRGAERGLARAAQHRPGDDHRGRGDRAHVPRRAGRGGARRSRSATWCW